MIEEGPWEEFFYIRKGHRGYYIAWNSSKKHVHKNVYFSTHELALDWIQKRWKRLIDLEFEKDFLK